MIDIIQYGQIVDQRNQYEYRNKVNIIGVEIYILMKLEVQVFIQIVLMKIVNNLVMYHLNKEVEQQNDQVFINNSI